MRVGIVNDYELVVEGLSRMLDDIEGVDVVIRGVDDGTGALAAGLEVRGPVDIALLDTYGRAGDGDDLVARLAANDDVRRVAVFTFDFHPQSIERALAHGATGYLWKGLGRADLVSALRQVSQGEQVISQPGAGPVQPRDGYRWPFDDLGLTARESEVLVLVAEGLTNRRIADVLFIGVETVKSHLREIFRKLRVTSRTHAAAVALRHPSFRRHVDAVPALASAVDSPSGAAGSRA